jgi:hypothetical protein
MKFFLKRLYHKGGIEELQKVIQAIRTAISREKDEAEKQRLRDELNAAMEYLKKMQQM